MVPYKIATKYHNPLVQSIQKKKKWRIETGCPWQYKADYGKGMSVLSCFLLIQQNHNVKSGGDKFCHTHDIFALNSDQY